MKHCLLIMIAAMSFWSCSQSEIPLSNDRTGTEKQTVLINAASTSNDVSIETVKKVSERFQPTVASRTVRTIEDISCMRSENGTPLYYIVNYAGNKGFMLVSATKDYSPVLAYSETGRFDLNKVSDSGISFWLEGVKHNLMNIDEIPDSVKQMCRLQWGSLDYDLVDVEIPKTNSRAIDEDAVADLTLKQIGEWKSQGYEVYNLMYFKDSNTFHNLPPQVQKDLLSLPYGNVNEFSGPYGPIGNSFVLIKNELPYVIGPLCTTTWGQKGWNTVLGSNMPLGCTTIAAGQIMKNRRYPTYFDWDSMSDNTTSDVGADFLYQLALKIGVKFDEDGSGASIDDVIKALRYYGYNSASIVNYSRSSISSWLINSPIYMRGDSSDGGHAWVCDGYRGLSRKYIELWGLENSPNEVQPKCYRQIYTTEMAEGFTTIHMNWGWGGVSNGWYNDAPFDAGGFTFNKNFKCIINIKKP